jgi:hypothetical protein
MSQYIRIYYHSDPVRRGVHYNREGWCPKFQLSFTTEYSCTNRLQRFLISVFMCDWNSEFRSNINLKYLRLRNTGAGNKIIAMRTYLQASRQRSLIQLRLASVHRLLRIHPFIVP